MRNRFAVFGQVILLFALAAGTAGTASAQSYPSKPVRILNAMGPGILDNIARIYAQDLAKLWGQPVIVESKTGGSTVLATELVVRAPADGYTVLATSSSTLTMTPFLDKDLPYDLDRDLKPVFAVGRVQYSVFVAARLNIGTLQEFIALARQKPGVLTYSSTGIGGATHLQTALFLSEVGGLQLLHVPYKAAGEHARGMISGEVDMGLHNHFNVAAGLKSGSLVPIVHIGERRSPEFPNLPTLRESGFPNASNSLAWFCFLVPAKTPPAIVNQLAAELARLSTQPAVRAVMEKTNLEPLLLGPEPFAALIQRERALIGKLVNSLGLKAQ